MRAVQRLPPDRLGPDVHDEYAAGVRAVLRPYAERGPGELVEDVPVDVLVGRRAEGRPLG